MEGPREGETEGLRMEGLRDEGKEGWSDGGPERCGEGGQPGAWTKQQLQLGLSKVIISTGKTTLSGLTATLEQHCHRCCLHVLSLRDMESVCAWQNCCQMSWVKVEAFQEMAVVSEPIKSMVLRCFDELTSTKHYK